LKAILKQTLLVLLFLGLWYTVIFCITYLFYPYSDDTNRIDTKLAKNTIFGNDSRYIIFNIHRIASSDKKKIFFIGSSKTKDGFRPDELQEYFPEYEIHNFALGGSQMAEMKQVVEYILSHTSDNSIKKSVFVIGMFYEFFRNKEKNKITHFTSEKLRYGLYELENGEVKPLFDAKLMPFISNILRPFLFVSNFIRIYNLILADFDTFFVRQRRIDFTVFLRHVYPELDRKLSKENIKNIIEKLNVTKQDTQKEGFKIFIDMCNLIKQKGAKIILLDLPIPTWHQKASTFFGKYQQRKEDYIKQVNNGNVLYINMINSLPDSTFLDSNHPYPTYTKLWSKTFADSAANFIKSK